MATFVAGKYKGRVTKWSVGVAGSGNPQFVLSFIPTALLAGGQEHSVPEFERSVFRAITPNTIEYFVKDLASLGYDRETFDELDPAHPDAFDFEGKELLLRLEYEDYQGKPKERWNLDFSGGLQIKPLERKELSKLNAMFGDKLRALKKPQANGQPATHKSALDGEAESVF